MNNQFCLDRESSISRDRFDLLEIDFSPIINLYQFGVFIHLIDINPVYFFLSRLTLFGVFSSERTLLYVYCTQYSRVSRHTNLYIYMTAKINSLISSCDNIVGRSPKHMSHTFITLFHMQLNSTFTRWTITVVSC